MTYTYVVCVDRHCDRPPYTVCCTGVACMVADACMRRCAAGTRRGMGVPVAVPSASARGHVCWHAHIHTRTGMAMSDGDVARIEIGGTAITFGVPNATSVNLPEWLRGWT